MSTELAWAAGFFDGEGCIRAAEQQYAPGRFTLRLIVSQRDRRPLDRFLGAVGVGTIYGPYPVRARGMQYADKWEWRVQNAAGVAKVVALLWAYLSEPKREQIAEARAVLAAQRPIHRNLSARAEIRQVVPRVI